MRSIFFGLVILLASTAVADATQAANHGYAQARQPIRASRDNLIDVDQIRPDEDALTKKRIEQEQDLARPLDRNLPELLSLRGD